jgi:hypothetical protein
VTEYKIDDGYVQSRHYTMTDIETDLNVLVTELYNIDTELTSRIDDVPTSTDSGNAKWLPLDQK